MLVQDVRTMFQVCRLVHADLSEYNILYYAGRLAIIDVSQVRLSSSWHRGSLRACASQYNKMVRAVGGPGPPTLLRLLERGPDARERLFQSKRRVACACAATRTCA